MNARLGWLLAAAFTFAAWRAYGIHGLAFAASAIVPKANLPKGAAAKAFEGLRIHPVERIEEAIDLVRTL